MMQDWRGTPIEVGTVVTTGYAGRQLEGVVVEARPNDPRQHPTVVMALVGQSAGGETLGAKLVVRADRLTVVQSVAQLDEVIERLRARITPPATLEA